MPEQQESVVDDGLVGPYSGDDNGRCLYGHGVNSQGRCRPLNEEECPRVTNDPNPGDTETRWDPEQEPGGRLD